MHYRSVLLILAFMTLASCTPSPHIITGKVTYDGAPLPDGDITFRTKDANAAATAAGKVKNGSYQINAKFGDYTVEIRASKLMPLPDGQKGAMGETELHQEYIGERYNTNTELSATVSGPKELNFELKSK